MQAYRESWRLAWPLILSNLSVPLLGFVDTAVVGHLESPHYLGAVALGASVVSVLYWLFGFLRMGTTALTAQAFGAADRDETRAAFGRALLLAVAFGLLRHRRRTTGRRRSAPSCSRRRPTWPPEFHRYLAIRLLGAPAALGSIALLGWLLGLQDSRGPLLLMLFTNGVNAVPASCSSSARHDRGGRGAGHGGRRICRPRAGLCWSCAAPGAVMAAGRAGSGSWCSTVSGGCSRSIATCSCAA